MRRFLVMLGAVLISNAALYAIHEAAHLQWPESALRTVSILLGALVSAFVWDVFKILEAGQ